MRDHQWASGAEAILADAPTGSLDPANAVAVMDQLAELSRDVPVVLVTHNLELARRYGARAFRCAGGRLESVTLG